MMSFAKLSAVVFLASLSLSTVSMADDASFRCFVSASSSLDGDSVEFLRVGSVTDLRSTDSPRTIDDLRLQGAEVFGMTYTVDMSSGTPIVQISGKLQANGDVSQNFNFTLTGEESKSASTPRRSTGDADHMASAEMHARVTGSCSFGESAKN